MSHRSHVRWLGAAVVLAAAAPAGAQIDRLAGRAERTDGDDDGVRGPDPYRVR